MKLNIGNALSEVGEALRRSVGLFLTVALTFNVLPSLMSSIAMPVPTAPSQGSVVQMLVLTAVVLLMITGWVAVQRLSLLGERVGDAVGRAPLPAARLFGLILLLSVPTAFLVAPFIPAYQSGTPDLQAAAATAMMLILIILLFPLSRLILALPLIAAAGSGVFGAIKRSWRLTRSNTWKLYGLILLFLFALGLMTFVAQRALGSVLLLLLGQPEPWSVSALLISLSVQLAQLTVTLPFTILIARLYAQAMGHGDMVSVPHAGHD